jgi:pyridoxamine 5'-phosphate oxidase
MDIKKHINTERKDFEKSTLEEFHLIENPFDFFKQWLGEAIEKNVIEANAFCLSTCVNNKPSSRIVYIRDIVENGFVFYTNYQSKKGEELKKNSNISANFFWADLERQVRIEGEIEKVSDEVSDKYFASRPRESQIGAWASMQSKKLSSRKELDDVIDELRNQFEGKEIPRPKFWGGYLIKPNYFEFWQGRKNRLHDRFSFEKTEHDKWIISRLYP